MAICGITIASIPQTLFLTSSSIFRREKKKLKKNLHKKYIWIGRIADGLMHIFLVVHEKIQKIFSLFKLSPRWMKKKKNVNKILRKKNDDDENEKIEFNAFNC